MSKIFYLESKYYKQLIKDKEFCIKLNRPYYLINKINYKTNIISIAVPLRSNINKRFQKNKNSYIKVTNTKHTLSYKGNIAGWHILKIVPVKKSVIYETKAKNKNLIKAIKIIQRNNSKEAIKKCNLLIKKIIEGKKVYGAINFDYYVKLLYK